jgi:hypothetical protein
MLSMSLSGVRTYIEALDHYIGSSTFGRIFRLEGSGHVGHLLIER